MSSEPRVTVFIPAYNSQAHISEAISSILDQTYRAFKLIIVNDGSTDLTVDQIKKFHDHRITLVNHENNLGIPRTRNHGLELAKSEYIALMDSDDYSDPDRLAAQVAFLDKNKDVGVCGTWYKKMAGATTKEIRFPQRHEEILFMLLFDNCFGQNTIMLRRSLIEQNELRYNIDFPLSEDYDFWARCAKHMRLANIPTAHVTYRFHPNNSSSRHTEEMRWHADRVRLLHLESFDIHPTEHEKKLHLDLLNFRFQGGLEHLNQSGQWLSSLAQIVIKKTGLPSGFVYRTFSRYWYSACANTYGNSYKVFRLFNSNPLGTHANIEFKAKIILRSLLGKRIKQPQM